MSRTFPATIHVLAASVPDVRQRLDAAGFKDRREVAHADGSISFIFAGLKDQDMFSLLSTVPQAAYAKHAASAASFARLSPEQLKLVAGGKPENDQK